MATTWFWKEAFESLPKLRALYYRRADEKRRLRKERKLRQREKRERLAWLKIGKIEKRRREFKDLGMSMIGRNELDSPEFIVVQHDGRIRREYLREDPLHDA